jgi:ABC-type antimicrobial peptide transport system permease subunit
MEIGALRAIGFPNRLVFKMLLIEGGTLAMIGGFSGILLTVLGYILFGYQIIQSTDLPLSLPSTANLVSFSVSGQTLAFISVAIAMFIPAWRISHQEVALTMQE